MPPQTFLTGGRLVPLPTCMQQDLLSQSPAIVHCPPPAAFISTQTVLTDEGLVPLPTSMRQDLRTQLGSKLQVASGAPTFVWEDTVMPVSGGRAVWMVWKMRTVKVAWRCIYQKLFLSDQSIYCKFVHRAFSSSCRGTCGRSSFCFPHVLTA